MRNKYIKDSKVIRVDAGQVVLQVTINTELLIEDLAKSMTSIIVETTKEFREFLEVVASFIDALPKRLQNEISKGWEE